MYIYIYIYIYICVSLYVNADKTNFLCFKQDDVISTFTYLGSNISSAESDVSIHIRKRMNCY